MYTPAGLPLLIGLDLGTSATKGVLLSGKGEILAREKAGTEFIYPEPGFVEIDPEAHYRSVCAVIRSLAAAAPDGADIRAVSMAAASGNTLLLDDDGHPLTRIISWLDTRPAGSGLGVDEVRCVTGWPCVDRFPPAHMTWLRAHAPEHWSGARRVVMNNDYLQYRLTGVFALDWSTATTFHIFDQAQCRWYLPFLDRFGVREEQLSDLAPPGTVVGEITETAMQDTGLPENCRVVSGSFDHPSAARACGVLEPGDVLLSCGTSWVGFYPVTDRDKVIELGMLADPFMQPDGPWGAMFSLPEVGRRVDDWLEVVFGSRDYRAFSDAAAEGSAAGGLRIDMLEDAPVDEKRRMVQEHGEAVVCRALMESTARAMCDRIWELAAAGIPVERITMVGGPTNSPIWPRILADQLGCEIALPEYGEVAGAVGAAILAGIGAGVFRDEREAWERVGK